MFPDDLRRTVYTGTLIDTPTLGELRVRHHAIVGVDERGCIAFLDERGGDGDVDEEEEGEEVRRVVRSWGWGSEKGRGGDGEVQGEWDWVRGDDWGWWFPGFVGEFSFFEGAGFLSEAVENIYGKRRGRERISKEGFMWDEPSGLKSRDVAAG